MKNNYSIDIQPIAKKQLNWWNKKGSAKGRKRLLTIFDDLSKHPLKGIGKPHALKHDLSGKYARTIDGEDRLVYSIDDEKMIVTVYSVRYHYNKPVK